MKENLLRINAAIKDLQAGKMIILIDAKERENEADLIFPAENTTTEMINFMINHGSGIICLALNPAQIKKLNLPLMVTPKDNTNIHDLTFTISIEAKHGITSGVSAADRAQSIRVAVQENSGPDDLVRPGHIFPLCAKSGGVLERAGHTEGSVDISRLAGFESSSVLCELMNPDGTMMRGEKLYEFAKQHELTILSIEDIIIYRLSHENLIAEQASAKLPLEYYGNFKIDVVKEKFNDNEHVILANENFTSDKPPLVRIHSACLTGDIFGSQRCDCQQQLHHSLQRISEEGGYLIYLKQEGRGIGLLNKVKAYSLQEDGLDTVEANQKLGCSIDERKYYFAAMILSSLKLNSVRLLTNNPLKVRDMELYSSIQITREPIPVEFNEHNLKYLLTKQKKLLHFANVNKMSDVEEVS
ncbi:MAG: 3,4-dihydroxy-2-butanone-4-phosphate synthase [Gammaproteobacteria bacterium]|nr:3,4-dihydroxy-2-butanone-4-phosphate synthase [Gammaproteobacteria bacterium]